MSYGGNADPSGIQVTFLDQTGAKSVKAVIAFSVPVSRIIPNIITKMSLPATSPDGQPMSYSLDHKEGGRRLLESWTLVEAGRPERRPSDRLPRGRGRPTRLNARNRCGPAMAAAGQPRIDPAGSSKQAPTRPRVRLRALDDDHVPISSHPPAPQRPGGPGAASLGKLGLPLHQPREIRRSNTVSSFRERVCGAIAARSRCSSKHHVEIKLGSSYPRTMPEIRWLTPIYHPNISEIGMVCLGGYGTHWVPSVQLDELCVDALGHGPVPQLRHSQPLQPRCRALGRQPDDVSVPDRRAAAPRPAGAPHRAGADRAAKSRHRRELGLSAEPARAVRGSAASPTTRRRCGRVRQFIERVWPDLRRRRSRSRVVPSGRQVATLAAAVASSIPSRTPGRRARRGPDAGTTRPADARRCIIDSRRRRSRD